MMQTLGMSGKQQTVWLQKGGKPLQDFILGVLIEIDHDIAAKNGIEWPSNRPLAIEQVELVESNQVT